MDRITKHQMIFKLIFYCKKDLNINLFCGGVFKMINKITLYKNLKTPQPLGKSLGVSLWSIKVHKEEKLNSYFILGGEGHVQRNKN